MNESENAAHQKKLWDTKVVNLYPCYTKEIYIEVSHLGKEAEYSNQ